MIDKNNIEIQPSATGVFNVANDQVYTLVLSNNNGKRFVQDETLNVGSITTANNLNNTQLSLKIAKTLVDSLVLSEQHWQQLRYSNITIESPQLPGGSNATATVRVLVVRYTTLKLHYLDLDTQNHHL
ncbi:hypothetical protein [uncultured phage MedDCM-OCT-S08-C1281]|nr:hypothetical protein [uncultured phage MedDCM-OCT-S08-C1281]